MYAIDRLMNTFTVPAQAQDMDVIAGMKQCFGFALHIEF
jgi:hypothetical protein